ncbi:hypothetical protein [Shewanella baltica]|uniref:hypothetical protein n=1 Tax=Shewanella baltica TaxID=62322 RepID=UPI00217EB617|nr:hypothetical protein [Shewanella baltica]MCS6098305.1 hypothetical protein [Shewanella baltica]MCS6181491.1 hypothetical protein [Shewanella baltica]
MAESDMGLINWLLSPREGYQYHRSGVGSLYAASLTFLSLAYTLSFLSSKNNISFIIKSVFYISLVFFWGSKGFILSFFSFLILCLWVVKYKYLNLVLLVFTPIVSLILLVNLALALGNVNFVNVVEYFDHYKNSAMFYESYLNGEFKLFHGKVFLSDFWSVVPRGLYEAKPYVYGISHVNELFFPGMAEKGHTPAFGGPVMEFSDFGVFSVFLFSLLNFSYLFKLYLFNYYFKMRGVVSFSKNSILILIFCICFSPMFLAYIPISLSIIFVFFIWLLIAFFARLRFKN